MSPSDDELISRLRARLANRTKPWRVDAFGPAPPEVRASAARPATFLPTTESVVKRAEEVMGLMLPTLLRRIYLQVANGGFGPAYGLLGIGQSGHRGFDEKDVVAVYDELTQPVAPEHSRYAWRKSLLPLWDWGCGMWSCADTATSDARIVTFDDRWLFTRTRFSLHAWISSWLDDVSLFEQIFEMADGQTMNPFTRQPMNIRRIVGPIGDPD